VAKRICIFWGLSLTLAGTFACEKIAHIEKKELIATPAPTSNCQALLSSGDFGLRVANLITAEDKLDVCVRPAGGQFTSAPLLQAGGSGCPTGVGYGQYTMPLNIDAGTYDVKLVAAAADCGAEGPTATGVVVTENQSTSLVAYGPKFSGADAQVAVLADATDKGNNVHVRLFHAENGRGAVDVGMASSASSADLTVPIFLNVDFGKIAPKNLGTFQVDAAGYMIYGNSGTDLTLQMGVSSVGSTSVSLNTLISLRTGHHYNLFLMGTAGASKTYAPKLWSCDEGVAAPDGFFAECGDPREIKVSIFHPNLTDYFTDYVPDREDKALAAIAASNANVLSLTELYSGELQNKLKASLPSGVNVVLSDDVPVSALSNLSDQNGQSVTWPDVSCDGDLKSALADLRDCLVTLPCVAPVEEGDASAPKHYFAIGGSLAIGCVGGLLDPTKTCADQIAAIVGQQSHAADQCFMCAIAHLSSHESLEDMYAACTSSSGHKPHYVFDGSTGLAMVTTLGLASDDASEVIALPASNWNRAALRVPLRLENNAIVDFWCADVRAPNADPFVQNGGPYYGDAVPGDALSANTAEEKLQIERLIAAVNNQATNTGRRAIVSVLTYSSPMVMDAQNKVLIDGLVPDNFALFGKSATPWQELVASSWTPACTWCGENELNSDGVNQAIVHLFGVGVGAGDVTETTRTFMSKAVELTFYDESPGYTPVSQYYGIQSTVRVTQ